MGRKTRKEKIIADLRRKLAMSNTETTPSQAIPIIVQPESISVYPVVLIKKDLTKTAILSILAISLELALFLIIQGKIRLPISKLVLPISLSFS
jgi:hypothetical protein